MMLCPQQLEENGEVWSLQRHQEKIFVSIEYEDVVHVLMFIFVLILMTIGISFVTICLLFVYM